MQKISSVTSAGITLLLLWIALSNVGISDTRMTDRSKNCDKNKNKTCPSEDRQKQEKGNDKSECTPGETFIRGCNECFCADGNPICTFMGCNETNPRPITPCKPGSTAVKDDRCNTCLCGENGRISSCTRRKNCTGVRPSEAYHRKASKCRPAERFLLNDNCNTCDCNNDGRLYDCTQKVCRGGKTIETEATTQGAKRIAMIPIAGEDMYWEYML